MSVEKTSTNKTKQHMVITDTPGSSFDKVAMDIVGPLPKIERGNEYILTLQDQLTKCCMGVPLVDQTSETIAEAFVDRLICVLGAPKAILTDQKRNFISDLMKKIAKIFRIRKFRTTAFHPQSNGSLERSHHALGEYLKQYANENNGINGLASQYLIIILAYTKQNISHTNWSSEK